MKKFFFIISLIVSTVAYGQALSINEIMSNPVGDDGGREWIELYNNGSSSVDLLAITISIKGANAVGVTLVTGATMLSPNEYAIISSTVTGASKFLQDYPTYTGPLLKSSISLVNTGVTSIEIKLKGESSDIISSYTAAKEGLTLSKIEGVFVSGNASPGAENQAVVEDSNVEATTATSNTNTTQSSVIQASLPTADIILYMPADKIVVAGAESPFSIFGLTHSGREIENPKYVWAYGDGGQSTGSSTVYRYAYPGTYIAQVEGSNGYFIGVGRMNVRVVAPDIFIKSVHTGKYGTCIDIENSNTYDLDFSQWKLTIDGVAFPFPKNTLIAGNSITHFSGLAMGFASTTIATSSSVKIVFPNLEEVTRYNPQQELSQATSSLLLEKRASSTETTFTTLTKLPSVLQLPQPLSLKVQPHNIQTLATLSKNKLSGLVLGVATSTQGDSTTKGTISFQKEKPKDTRIVAFFKSFFNKK